MKRKWLLTALFMASVAAFTCGVTACTAEEGEHAVAHVHNWGAWAVAAGNVPTETAEGKATRTCTAEGCDAAAADREYSLPVFTSSDYTKGTDSATCIAGGAVTYTYNKEGVNVSFEVATEINSEAHAYGEYTYTDGTGHYKVCSNNDGHKTAAEAHDTFGAGGACSECGYTAPVIHSHKTGGAWITTNSVQHYKYCTDTNCPNPTEKLLADDHDTDGEDGVCSVCGYVPPVQHTHTPGNWVREATQHYKLCQDTNCLNPTEKLFGGSHDEDGDEGACSVCGYVPPVQHTHTPGNWITTNSEKHYKLCTDGDCDNPSERLYENDHDEDGAGGACSVCGYTPEQTNEGELSPIHLSTTVKAGGGKTATVYGYTGAPGYWVYSYGGAKPVTVNYNYNLLGANEYFGQGQVTGTVTLSADGQTSFIIYLESHGTCTMTVTSTEATEFDVTVNAEFAQIHPNNILALDTAKEITADYYDPVTYMFKAAVSGKYTLTCTGDAVDLLVKDNQKTLPYTFTLAANESVEFSFLSSAYGEATFTACVTRVVEPDHVCVWSSWTVTENNKPDASRTGKATRTCSGAGTCDAATADKEHPLPNLLSADYAKSANSATCTVGGAITYTYNKEGVNVSFDIATEANPSAHDYGNWTYTDGTGHYKVCSYNSSHKTTAETHDEDGEDGGCSLCGYVPHRCVWSSWTVTEGNKPDESRGGKATRTCSGAGTCDAEQSEREHPLPNLLSADYAKSANSATCTDGGAITYTYNKEGVTVSFDIATEANPSAHDYGNWTYTDGTGHYKVCSHNSSHKTTAESHDEDGEDGGCSLCGYMVPHSHSWNAWEVLPANVPTDTKKGKATRTCGGRGQCNGTAEDNEHELPVLSSADYSTENDSATCSATGTATYTYNKNGVNVSFEAETPVNANVHNRGEWNVTTLPSASAAGVAKKVCAYDTAHAHDITVQLPALPASGNGGYASVAPDANDAYLTVYTYETQYGDVVFTVPRELTVQEAVELSVARNGGIVEGTIGYHQDLSLEEYIVIDVENSFEFGDGYLHMVNNGERNEYWYNYDNGQLIAIRKKVVTDVETDGEDGPIIKKEDREVLEKDVEAYTLGEAEIFKGYAYNFFVLGAGHTERGTANFIAYLYGLAKANVNGDFTESKEVSNGATTYNFSFGLFEDGNNKYFHFTEVSFTLDGNNVLVGAVLDTKTYVNGNYSPIGNGRYKAIGTPVNHETFTVTQSTAHASGSAPVCPLDYDELFVHSFILKTGGAVVGDSLTLAVGSETTLSIANLTPNGCNLTADPITFILTGDVNGSYTETQLTDVYIDGEAGHIVKYFNQKNNTVTLTPYVAGEFTLIVKTFLTEREIHVSIPFETPADFGVKVYKVDETQNQAEWRKYDTEFTIYAGQQLAFTSFVGVPEYEDAAFTVTAGGATVTDGEIDGEAVKMFTAATAGEYTVTLTAVSGGKKASFKVKVKAVPTRAEILNGVYESDDSGITVTFVPAADGATAGTATIVIGGENESITAVDYSCDTEGNVNVTYRSGNSGYGFSFEITENYNLLIQITEGGNVQRVYLHKEGEYARPLDGTYRLGSAANSIEHVVTIAGIYTVEYDRGCSGTDGMPYTRHYEINGNPVLGVPMTVSLILEAGDTFKVYANAANINTETFHYTISTTRITQRVTGISFNEPSVVLGINCSTTLTPVVNPSNATVKDVLWTSSDESIVLVNGSGEITARAQGTVTITATTVDGGFVATCTVNAVKIPVERIELSEDTLYFTYGSGGSTPSRIKLTVNVYPATATDKEYTFTIGDNTVVTFIQSTGYVSVYKVGTTTITFTSKSNPSVTAVCTIVVQAPVVTPTGITLDKTSQTVEKNGTFTLTATVVPDNAADKTVVWTSSDTSVATVVNGVVTAVGEGTATITATTCNGLKATCAVTVPVKPTGITLSRTEREITEGSNFTLTATVAPDNAADKTVTWTSSDTYVATVSETGVVTAVGAGTATITATTCNGLEATCAVTVTALVVEILPTGITLDKTSQTVGKGNSFTLTATVAPDNVTDETVTWTSSNTAVATVENGVVTAVGIGTATITATTCNGLEATCAVTVEPILPAGITLNKTSHTMAEEETFTLTATVAPANATDKTVIWTSSNTAVATVENGVVTAVGAGTATITATAYAAGTVTAACTVTVNAKAPARTVTINYTSITLEYDAALAAIGEADSKILSATVTPQDTWDVLSWSSSNTNVARVSYGGIVTATGVGVAVITVTVSGDETLYAECVVTVVEAQTPEVEPTGIVLSSTDLVIRKFDPSVANTRSSLTATVLPEGVSRQVLVWTVSQNGILMDLDPDGYTCPIMGKAYGKVTVTVALASNPGIKATCTVAVVNPVTSISFSKPDLNLTVGGTSDNEKTVVLNISPSNASDITFDVSISDPTVVEVTYTEGINEITFKPLKAGEATVTVIMKDGSGCRATCNVTVTESTGGEDDGTIKEGVNHIPYIELGIWDTKGRIDLNLPAGKYKLEATRDGQPIDNFCIYFEYGFLSVTEITVSGPTFIQVMDGGKSIQPFDLTITKIA